MSEYTPYASYWRTLEAEVAHQVFTEEDDPHVVKCKCGEIFFDDERIGTLGEIIRAFKHGFEVGAGSRS